MLQELFPDAENVGLLYCSAEPNSVFQVETIQGYLEGDGLHLYPVRLHRRDDLSAVTQSACDGSDVIYIPTDNTAAKQHRNHRQCGHPRRGCPWYAASLASAPAAAWPPSPSAMRSWAVSPVRWRPDPHRRGGRVRAGNPVRHGRDQDVQRREL